ncbi:hypothetical protein BCR42DRAFT_386411 [Absidia repens]|uniref:Uncharacterized protein n=1 Tax=Absidia repens TaxID=90262 RepID=A0A1X2J1W7_9FUNG|nr:hypothetical protein BCR42DRAFT_386411 [Absidia repens]
MLSINVQKGKRNCICIMFFFQPSASAGYFSTSNSSVNMDQFTAPVLHHIQKGIIFLFEINPFYNTSRFLFLTKQIKTMSHEYTEHCCKIYFLLGESNSLHGVKGIRSRNGYFDEMD